MTEEIKETKPKYAETYGGTFGAVLPMLVMVATIAVLFITGLKSTQTFWVAGFFGVSVGMFVFKDKERFQTTVFEGLKNESFVVMTGILLFSGVIGNVLSACHIVDALLYLLTVVNFPPVLIPAVCFLLATLMSLFTGSAVSAMLAIIPLMLPVGVQMGCNAGFLMGAIVSGGVIGDNMAPVSDTMITSSLTQEVDIMDCVKSRLRFNLTACTISLVLFVALSFVTTNTAAAQHVEVSNEYLASFAFVLVPACMIILILKNVNFLVAMIVTDLVGIAMLVIFGYADITSILAADGIIVGGINEMVGPIIFMMFVFMLLAILQETGVMDKFQQFLMSRATSDRAVEIASAIFVCVTCMLTTSGMSTIALCGPVIRKMMKPRGISRARSANLLDALACGVGYMLPYDGLSQGLVGMAVSMGVVGAEFTVFSYLPYNFGAIMLIVVYWVAILTGWGRTYEPVDAVKEA